MAIEVELKAWVDDPAAVERRLRGMSTFEADFVKEDVYYHAPDCPPDGAGQGGAAGTESGDEGGRDFRLRMEDGTATVTFKRKRREGGMEINEEREFTVSDAEAFRELVRRIGCRPYIRKRKQGRRFSRDGIVLELSEVEHLGWFLEIEKMLTGPAAEEGAIRDAGAAVRGLFARVGIPEKMIEIRNYTDLLRERGAGAP